MPVSYICSLLTKVLHRMQSPKTNKQTRWMNTERASEAVDWFTCYCHHESKPQEGKALEGLVENQDATDHLKRPFTRIRIYDLSDHTCAAWNIWIIWFRKKEETHASNKGKEFFFSLSFPPSQLGDGHLSLFRLHYLQYDADGRSSPHMQCCGKRLEPLENYVNGSYLCGVTICTL